MTFFRLHIYELVTCFFIMSATLNFFSGHPARTFFNLVTAAIFGLLALLKAIGD